MQVEKFIGPETESVVTPHCGEVNMLAAFCCSGNAAEATIERSRTISNL